MSKDEIVFDDEKSPRKQRTQIPPYEIEDPIISDEIDKMFAEKYRAETCTGRKAIAIIDEPKSCRWCIFMRYRWASPFWAKADSMMDYHNQPNTKGIMCGLLPGNQIVTVVDYDDETYKPNWCPLKSIDTLEQRYQQIAEVAKEMLSCINDPLDFVNRAEEKYMRDGHYEWSSIFREQLEELGVEL